MSENPQRQRGLRSAECERPARRESGGSRTLPSGLSLRMPSRPKSGVECSRTMLVSSQKGPNYVQDLCNQQRDKENETPNRRPMDVVQQRLYARLNEKYPNNLERERTDLKRRVSKSATERGRGKPIYSKGPFRPKTSEQSKQIICKSSKPDEGLPDRTNTTSFQRKNLERVQRLKEGCRGLPQVKPPGSKGQGKKSPRRLGGSTFPDQSDTECLVDISTRTLSPQKLYELSCPQGGRRPKCQAKQSKSSTAGPSNQKCLQERMKTTTLEDQNCDRQQPQGKKFVAFGPSNYPLVPGMYETAYRQLPGPKEIILRDGDINPNDTTIIDITGLTPQDPIDIGLPVCPISIEEDPQSPTSPPPPHPGTKEYRKMIENKKKKRAREKRFSIILPSQRKEMERKEREEEKQRREKEKTLECERGRGYLGKRKVEYRENPFTEEEIKELEEYRRKRREQWERERRQRDKERRGLKENDLLDIDTEAEPITGNTCLPTPPDPWGDGCLWEEASPLDWVEDTSLNAMRNFSIQENPRCWMTPGSPEVNLWDSCGASSSPPAKQQLDFITRSPEEYLNRNDEFCKNDLLQLDPPDTDFLGLRTPNPSCGEGQRNLRQSPGDMLKFGSPVPEPLPFDVGPDYCEADIMLRQSPNLRGLPTPLKTVSPGRQISSPGRNQPWNSTSGCTKKHLSPKGGSKRISPNKLFDGSPGKNIRKVKAIVNPDDPNSAILETSLTATRKNPRRPKCTPEKKLNVNFESSNESLGILRTDQEEDESDACEFLNPADWGFCGVEDFHKPVRRQLFKGGNANSVPPCSQDNDDLGILDIPEIEDIVPPGIQYIRRATTNISKAVQGKERNIMEEDCPFPQTLDEIDEAFECERADLLGLYRDQSPLQTNCQEPLGPRTRELIEQIGPNFNDCDDLLGMFCNTASEVQEELQFGSLGQELLEEVRDEADLIDIDENCPPDQGPAQYQFGYSANLFTNIEWQPELRERYKELWKPPSPPCDDD